MEARLPTPFTPFSDGSGVTSRLDFLGREPRGFPSGGSPGAARTREDVDLRLRGDIEAVDHDDAGEATTAPAMRSDVLIRLSARRLVLPLDLGLELSERSIWAPALTTASPGLNPRRRTSPLRPAALLHLPRGELVVGGRT
jgi:hypothetical protein